ncbi:hypothetical protein C1H71_00005 [Iodobacter fluviatilis]|uniref:Uncharacterized protein n=1 Tax=Iodobacter fluviatilis TaxID=537 RepID=A0A7G3G4Q3_9NEIS|nr:hypothetical protein C1H71_00005 [Iodobacter fluviatilis]
MPRKPLDAHETPQATGGVRGCAFYPLTPPPRKQEQGLGQRPKVLEITSFGEVCSGVITALIFIDVIF